MHLPDDPGHFCPVSTKLSNRFSEDFSGAKCQTWVTGKKRRHILKTQIISNSGGLIIHKTPHVHGKKHDYELFKRRHPPLPSAIEIEVDLGYQGIENNFALR
jgi:hypothetical protein